MSKKLLCILLLGMAGPIFAKRHDTHLLDRYQAWNYVQTHLGDQFTEPGRREKLLQFFSDLLRDKLFKHAFVVDEKKVKLAFVTSALQNERYWLLLDKQRLEQELESFKRRLPERREIVNNNHFLMWKGLSETLAVYANVVREVEKQYLYYRGLLSRRSAGDIEAKLLSMGYWRRWVGNNIEVYMSLLSAQEMWDKSEFEEYLSELYDQRVFEARCDIIKRDWGNVSCGTLFESNSPVARYEPAIDTESDTLEVEGPEHRAAMKLHGRPAQDLSEEERLSDWDEKIKTDTDAQTDTGDDSDDKWGSYVRDTARDTDSETGGELPPREDLPSHDADSDADEPPPLEDVPEDEISEQELAGQEFAGQEPASEEGGEWTSY